jgi:murein DD-endopeptidase MepM/ murein hydrolase activator NlpD
MAEKTKKRSFIRKLRDKYRLIIYNDNTFEEVMQLRLSRLILFSIFSSMIIVLAVIISLLIAFTPLKEFIPGYPESDIRRIIHNNTVKVDSLKRELQLRNHYLKNINMLVSGNTPVAASGMMDTVDMENREKKEISFSKSKRDSVFRKQIEQEEKFNLTYNKKTDKKDKLSEIHFFTPLKGIITNSFDMHSGHYGTDVVASNTNVVKAALDGVVIMSAWTLKTGYIIQIQHKSDLISVYKHNANLFKKTGDLVKAGEAIAIVGNSGELSTGPHLHFELWHKGQPLNAEDYIRF